MKTKLKLLALVCALTINAGAAEQSSFQGELGFGYTSDYYFRGAKVSDESTQIQARLTTNVGIADAFVSAFANNGLQSTDSYQFAVGLAKATATLKLSSDTCTWRMFQVMQVVNCSCHSDSTQC